MGEPKDPVLEEKKGGLANPPLLVKVDRYGSVSGLVEVEVPLGKIVLIGPWWADHSEAPYVG